MEKFSLKLEPSANVAALADELSWHEKNTQREIVGIYHELLSESNFFEYVVNSFSENLKPLIVEKVPSSATSSKEAFRKFISPFIDSAELLARSVVEIGGAKQQIVILREIDPSTSFIDPNVMTRVLRGDGTWPWVAYANGPDIYVFDAKATAFGGDSDPQDSGQTASGFPTKGNPDLLGCALPMEYKGSSAALKRALGGSPIPKMPFGISSSGQIRPDGAHVRITDRKSGTSITVPVIDLGPAKKTGHAIDLTVAAAKVFNPNASATNFGMKLDYKIINGATLGGIGTEGGFTERLASSALTELARFEGIDEGDDPLAGQIYRYWTELGFNFPNDGVEEAWSAVFVSWNLKNAGASPNEFRFSPQHSVFVYDAISNANDPAASFVGHEISRYAPKVGDIIQWNRPENDFSFSYAESNPDYESHSAIVVELGSDSLGKYAKTVGGNERDSVRSKTIRLHSTGRIAQRVTSPFISVIETKKA